MYFPKLFDAIADTYENNWTQDGRYALSEMPKTADELRAMVDFARRNYPQNAAAAIIETIINF